VIAKRETGSVGGGNAAISTGTRGGLQVYQWLRDFPFDDGEPSSTPPFSFKTAESIVGWDLSIRESLP
jgi:hypothetical protein